MPPMVTWVKILPLHNWPSVYIMWGKVRGAALIVFIIRFTIINPTKVLQHMEGMMDRSPKSQCTPIEKSWYSVCECSLTNWSLSFVKTTTNGYFTSKHKFLTTVVWSLLTAITGQVLILRIPRGSSKTLGSVPVTLTDEHLTCIVSFWRR